MADVLQEKMNDKQQWGLKALGKSGGTQVDLDESCSGEVLYDLEINKPSWILRCRIATTDIVADLIGFLTTSSESSFSLGTLSQSAVQVLRDDEFADRFFIVAGGEVGSAHFTISGPEEIEELRNALEQVAKEL